MPGGISKLQFLLVREDGTTWAFMGARLDSLFSLLIWHFAGGRTHEWFHPQTRDSLFYLLVLTSALGRSGMLFPGGLIPARASHLDTELPAKGRMDTEVLQGLSTLCLQLSLPPASAALSLVRGRLAGLIVCSRSGSSRNSGWLGNKAAVWPRGEPAAPPLHHCSPWM